VAARAAGVSLAVHDEGHAAVRAIDGAGALAAEDGGREPAAVEEHERLFAALQPCLDRVAQRAAQNHIRTLGGEFLAHVHDLHVGERTVQDATREHDALVLSRHRMVIRLDRRRRGSEHDQRLGALGADDRHVASVVAWDLFLLVGTVVLFVDDDESNPLQGREHRGSRADHDVHVAAADAVPLIVALAVGEAAVLDSDAVAEGVAEERGDRRRQRDFRHEHQHAAAGVASRRREAEVDFGFAAAGDAVQKGDVERARVGEGAEAVEGGLLLAGQASQPGRDLIRI
jgi:hypothetical protein